jgi:hypothetical protein
MLLSVAVSGELFWDIPEGLVGHEEEETLSGQVWKVEKEKLGQGWAVGF